MSEEKEKKIKLKGVADQAGLSSEHIEDEKQKKRGPKPGTNKKRYTPVRNMKTRELQQEVGRHRKEIGELEQKLEAYQSGESPEGPWEIPAEMYAVIPVFVYDFLANRFGGHWKLNEDETIIYGQAIKRVIDRHMGEIAGDNPELFGLAVVIGSTAAPRIALSAALSNISAEVEKVSGKEKNNAASGK